MPMIEQGLDLDLKSQARTPTTGPSFFTDKEQHNLPYCACFTSVIFVSTMISLLGTSGNHLVALLPLLCLHTSNE